MCPEGKQSELEGPQNLFCDNISTGNLFNAKL